MAKLEAKVEVTGTEIYRQVLTVVGDILKDDRIEETLRKEYHDRMTEILTAAKA